MRQITFRGKTKDGEWVYGYYFDGYILQYIDLVTTWESSSPYDMNVICRAYEVLPETVGQSIGIKGYTGEFKDRHNNEVKLFEGDIVEAWSEGSKGTFVIVFRNESAPMWLLYPNWQSGKHWNIHGSDLGRAKGDYYDDLRRVGNIHDNPELLK